MWACKIWMQVLVWYGALMPLECIAEVNGLARLTLAAVAAQGPDVLL